MKLDLHTHCREATSNPDPTPDIVRSILDAARSKGLDGIAITEHYTKAYAYKVKAIVDECFPNELLIIPGQEIDRVYLGIEKGVVHIVELDLPGDLTFRFIAHPGHPYMKQLEMCIDGEIHGIELKNPHHDRDMDEGLIRSLASQHNLLLLTNSDAHTLGDIGHYWNRLELSDLCARVGGQA